MIVPNLERADKELDLTNKVMATPHLVPELGIKYMPPLLVRSKLQDFGQNRPVGFSPNRVLELSIGHQSPNDVPTPC